MRIPHKGVRATPVQEIAHAFQIANAYIQELVNRGLDPDQFVGRFSFNLNVFGNLWEQVAKFRAARKLWARNLTERWGVKEKKPIFKGVFWGGRIGSYQGAA